VKGRPFNSDLDLQLVEEALLYNLLSRPGAVVRPHAPEWYSEQGQERLGEELGYRSGFEDDWLPRLGDNDVVHEHRQRGVLRRQPAQKLGRLQAVSRHREQVGSALEAQSARCGLADGDRRRGRVRRPRGRGAGAAFLVEWYLDVVDDPAEDLLPGLAHPGALAIVVNADLTPCKRHHRDYCRRSSLRFYSPLIVFEH
jgi:hypothetical protein